MADAEQDNTGGKVVEPIFHLLPDAPRPVAPYSHAVEAGPFIFVTGQLATDPDDDSLPIPPAPMTAKNRRLRSQAIHDLNAG